MNNSRNIQKRIASLKELASVMLEEAINMEKELGLIQGPTPQRGLSKKDLVKVRIKRESRISKTIQPIKN